MAITRSQIARQLMAEGGVSLDDAKMMAPEGEFLAYINPKEAQMLKDAGGSGIMTPMGIPSFVDFGGSGSGYGSAQDTFDAAGGNPGRGGGPSRSDFGGNGDGGGSPPPSTGGGSDPIKAKPTYVPSSTIPNYGKNISNFERYMATLATGVVSPTMAYRVNKGLKEEQEKQKNLITAIQGGQQFFGTTPRSLTTQYKKTTGMDTGPKGPISEGGDSPIIPRLPQVASLPTDIETPASDSQKQFDVRFFLDPRFAAKDGGEVSVDDAEKMAPPGESLAYINDDEAALLRAIGGAGEPVNQTGIPSYFIKKVFRKAKKAVKKIVKSPIGKAALAGAAIYGLGGGAAFGGKGFAFGNLPGASFFKAVGNPAQQLAQGSRFSQLFGKAKDALGGNVGLGIAAASVAGGLMSKGEEEETDSIASRISKETGLPIAQIRKEVQDAYKSGDISGLQSKYAFLVPTSAALKDGGEVKKKKAFKYRKKPYGPKFAADGGIMMASNLENDKILENLFEKYLDMGLSPKDAADKARQEFEKMSKAKKSDRTMAKDGGIMSLGGMEMDLRGGGFVPIGKAEKADDVPARLSKNEFVFTADAVRAAGGGSVDKGADLMYKTMKQLEDRVA